MPSPFTRLSRRWASSRWPRALKVDRGLAEAEGLAAGTGLLTGDIARTRAMWAPCPECGGRGDALVIDLIGNSVSRRCERCTLRWDDVLPVASRSAR